MANNTVGNNARFQVLFRDAAGAQIGSAMSASFTVLSTAPITPLSLKNGDFATSLAGWSVYGTTAQPVQGNCGPGAAT